MKQACEKTNLEYWYYNEEELDSTLYKFCFGACKDTIVRITMMMTLKKINKLSKYDKKLQMCSEHYT